jgi:hypothetical protein
MDYGSREGTIIAIAYPQKKYRSAKLRVFIEFMTGLMADLRREGIVERSISYNVAHHSPQTTDKLSTISVHGHC